MTPTRKFLNELAEIAKQQDEGKNRPGHAGQYERLAVAALLLDKPDVALPLAVLALMAETSRA